MLDFKNVRILGVRNSRGSKCAIVPNFAAISRTAGEMAMFRFFSMAAAAVLNF